MKRTIKKKTLDELRKCMPVIPEEEMAEINGVVMYYNQSGVYLGKIGESDELRFVGDVPFDQILRQVTSTMASGPMDTFKERQEAAAKNVGDNWSNASNVARFSFVKNMINNESALSPLRSVFKLKLKQIILIIKMRVYNINLLWHGELLTTQIGCRVFMIEKQDCRKPLKCLV